APQQRRCHDLDLELMGLKQTAEAAEKRRAAIADELAALAAEEAAEREARAGIDAAIAMERSRHATEARSRDATARAGEEADAAELRGAEEARLTVEQKVEPARARIEEARLKEQAALLSEQQFSEQLTEAHADLAALPAALKAWGRASTLPGEIERLTQAIADLGAVNLAALDELKQSTERKQYLDSQAQ